MHACRVRVMAGAGLKVEPLAEPPTSNVLCRGPLVTLTMQDDDITFRWGQPAQIGSAAYWVEQARLKRPAVDLRLGDSLEEEVVACLLGGFGVRAEVGLAAFLALRSAGLIRTDVVPSARAIEERLLERLELSDGRQVHYRFPRQRSMRIVAALRQLADQDPPDEPQELRGWLMSVNGIGPKTASWIVRNRTGSADLAVIDVHVLRAGVAGGFFSPEWRIPRDYRLYEEAFLSVAGLGEVSSIALDWCIWSQLRFLGRAGRSILERSSLAPAVSLGCERTER